MELAKHYACFFRSDSIIINIYVNINILHNVIHIYSRGKLHHVYALKSFSDETVAQLHTTNTQRLPYQD